MSWLLTLALPFAMAGCIGEPDDGGQPPPAVDSGQDPADAAPAADAGPADAASGVDAAVDAMGSHLDADACEHMINGPSQIVMPPGVTPSHARWDSGLEPGSSGWYGASFDLLVEESGRIFVYKRAELSTTIQAANGNEVSAVSIEATACSSEMERHTFDLVAGYYTLGVGSFYVSTAELVILRADDPGH